MTNTRTFHAVSIGASHIDKNIPCQDSAGSYEDKEKGIYIAVISDGHGSEKHFMSQHGSRILIDATLDTIRDFIDNDACKNLIVEYSASENLGSKDNDIAPEQINGRKNREQNTIITNLISSIISNWNSEIEKDWRENAPDQGTMKEKKVPEDSIDDYLKGINLEFAYGCTLIAFARTTDLWFAFQIGDGACIAFNDNAEIFYPIPADERFTGSTTASMCDSDALGNFRYGYGNTKTPIAVFLGSDGLDGVFGTMDEYSFPRLEQLYSNIVKMFTANGYEDTLREIEKTLPELSAKGITRDDMSLAGIIDFEKLNTAYPLFLQNDIVKVKKEIEDAEKEYRENILKYEEKQKELINILSKHETQSIKIGELDESILITEEKIKELKISIDPARNEIVVKTAQLEETDSFINKLKDNIKASKFNVDKVDEAKQRLIKKLNDFNNELNQIRGNIEPINDLPNKPIIAPEVPDTKGEADCNENKQKRGFFDKIWGKKDN